MGSPLASSLKDVFCLFVCVCVWVCLRVRMFMCLCVCVGVCMWVKALSNQPLHLGIQLVNQHDSSRTLAGIGRVPLVAVEDILHDAITGHIYSTRSSHYIALSNAFVARLLSALAWCIYTLSAEPGPNTDTSTNRNGNANSDFC